MSLDSRANLKKNEKTSDLTRATVQDIEDKFCELFVRAGFVNLFVTKIDLPDHIVDWVKVSFELEVQKDVIKALDYFRVTTDQCVLGILLGAHAALDLKDSGVTPEQLGIEEPLGETLVLLEESALGNLLQSAVKKIELSQLLHSLQVAVSDKQ